MNAVLRFQFEDACYLATGNQYGWVGNHSSLEADYIGKVMPLGALCLTWAVVNPCWDALCPLALFHLSSDLSNFASQSLVEMGFKKKILLLFSGNEFFQAHLTLKKKNNFNLKAVALRIILDIGVILHK